MSTKMSTTANKKEHCCELVFSTEQTQQAPQQGHTDSQLELCLQHSSNSNKSTENKSSWKRNKIWKEWEEEEDVGNAVAGRVPLARSPQTFPTARQRFAETSSFAWATFFKPSCRALSEHIMLLPWKNKQTSKLASRWWQLASLRFLYTRRLGKAVLQELEVMANWRIRKPMPENKRQNKERNTKLKNSWKCIGSIPDEGALADETA